MKPASLPRVILALIPLVVALPFAMDIYVPAIPSITHDFHISTAMVQLTLNLFMLISGVAQLIFGPLTDHYGRQKVTIFATVIFFIGSLCCCFSLSFTTLIIGRVLQAIGSCGMMVLGFAIARDIYDDIRLAKVYGYLNGTIAISPMFGPFIGSYLDVYFGWHATFAVLVVVCVLAMVLYFSLLSETLPIERRSSMTRRVAADYQQILMSPVFSIFTLATAFGISYLFIFCAISSVLIISLLHIPELHYGYYFCFMGVSIFLGSIVSTFIVERLGIFKTVMLGYVLSLLGGILMFVWYQITGLTLSGLIWPMLLIGIGGTFGLSAGNAGAMMPFGDNAGMASALGGAIRFFYAGIVGLLFANHITSTMPLAIPAVLQSIIGIMVMLGCRRMLTQPPEHASPQ